jgi:hypothetical protein
MTEARLLMESLTIPIADRIGKVMPVAPDESLVQWARLQGWDNFVDKRVVARQAALNLVLRALLCHCLGATHELPVEAPAHLVLAYNNKLLQDLGISPQPSSYLDHLAVQAEVTLQTPPIATLVSLLQREKKDIIGDVYALWIPQDARRPLGQFWTPPPIAQLMAQWTIRSPDDCVLDPAFGSGIFLLTAIERLNNLKSSIVSASRLVSGVELSPLVFLIGLTNVLLRYPHAQLRLRWGDFLIPQREPLAILKEPAATTYEVGARQMALPELGIITPTAFPEPFDAIVCNPPYTRHHHLPEAYKSVWAAAMHQEYGIQLSRFSSLFAYFFVQASRMLSPRGRMAFITPATVFEASYSSQVKAFIRRQLRLRAIISFDEALSVFEGVDTAACITLVEGPQAENAQIVHVQIRQWPGVEPVLQAIEHGGTETADWGSSHELDFSTLEPRRKWTVIGHKNGRFDNDHFVPLAEIAHIMRGIATGANDFFVLSDNEAAKWKLNRANLRPVLTKTREASRYIFNQADFERLGREGKKRWLLYLTEPVAAGSAEARYIQYGESCGLHQRSLVKTRSLWYMMERRSPAPIYFTYLSRKRSRFIYNQANMLALNVFLCIYPIPTINQDETMLKALLAMLNSLVAKDALRHVGRTYGNDTIKVEPREMDRLPVLNPVRLAAHERKKLAELFDQLCCANSENEERAVRHAIDEMLATTEKHFKI